MNELKKQKRWVLWAFEEVEGRKTKVPYTIRGKRASSTNPADWATYADAKKALHNFGDGVGVVFTPEKTLLGIDIDHVIQETNFIGEHAGEVAALVEKANTYTETSPSGTGLHLYFRLSGSLTLKGNRHAPWECYTAGRFFTFTEDPFGSKKAKPIREITPEEAEALLETIGYPWKKQDEVTPSQAVALLDGSFDDMELTRRMFASKNGEQIRVLWDGDTTAYEKDDSRADAALLNHLAFWSRKNPEQMERLWLLSPLGKRKKTQSRKDYRTRSIKAAIATTKKVYEDPLAGIEFLTTSNAKGDKLITQNTENICRIMRAHPEFESTLRYDTFTGKYEMREGDRWRQFQDVDALNIQSRIAILFPFFQKVGKDMVYDACLKVMNENVFDSAMAFIKSLEWDGEARLDTWLSKTYGVEDNEYHRAVASNWLKGLVSRIMRPGCKFDFVLVLEGEQGVRKSTSLAVLGGEWHVETTMSTDSKDFFMQMQGKVILEFSEGETLSRTEVKKMKAIITMQVDTFRPPYSRTSQDFPRRCVFAMTTNQEEYLKDDTGNRRWLPVKVLLDKADTDWLAENRNQLLAEAWARVEKGETVYEFPEEETKRQQSMRRVADPNTEKIAEWYYDSNFMTDTARENGITISQVYYGALGGMIGTQMKKYEEMAIADVLANALGLIKKRTVRHGVQAIRWYPNPKLRIVDGVPELIADEHEATA